MVPEGMEREMFPPDMGRFSESEAVGVMSLETDSETSPPMQPLVENLPMALSPMFPATSLDLIL